MAKNKTIHVQGTAITLFPEGFWETMYNPDFKPLEFEGFRKQAGLNSFDLKF